MPVPVFIPALTDRNLLVSAYGINEKSKIAIVGGGANSVPAAKAAPERRTEETTIKQIRTELDKLEKNLQPDVDQFLSALHATPTATAAAPKPLSPPVQADGTPAKQTDLTLEHARLGELLLQSLLRLDAIIAEGEWEEARRERKSAVKQVQGLLDRLDNGWKQRLKSS